jgi:hypothetical protein
MKTAYELAMERLSKTTPVQRLTDEQKKEVAEVESRYAAKIAEREVFLKGEIEKALDLGKDEVMEQLQKQLVSERKALQAQLEEKKEEIRKKS